MLGLALATKKYLFGITCLVEKPLHMAEWQAILFSPGMLEGGRQGGQLPPPDFGRSEGAAGQRQRAALLPAPSFLDFATCLQSNKIM